MFLLSTDFDLDRLNRNSPICARTSKSSFVRMVFARPTSHFGARPTHVISAKAMNCGSTCPTTSSTASAIARAFEQFHSVHQAEYGHSFRAKPYRDRQHQADGRCPDTNHSPRQGAGRRQPSGGPDQDGRLLFPTRSGRLEQMDTAFYRRELLPIGPKIVGPAIILQTDSTTVVPPGSTLSADAGGNLIVQRQGAK